MNALALLRRQSVLAVSYALVSALAIQFIHPEGRIALLWGASALLIAALFRTAPRHWWAPLAACMVPAMMLTAALGWWLFFALTVLNGVEALVAAWLLRRSAPAAEALSSHRWTRGFLIAAIVAPLAVAPGVALALALTGGKGGHEVVHYVAGHALGNLIFTPFALMLSGQRARRETMAMLRVNLRPALAVLFLSLAAALLVFAQSRTSIMFLASLVAVGATVRLGREGAAVSIAVIALVGALATGSGIGPVFLMPLSIHGQLLMFQLFLAATCLTVLPVAAELESRKALLRRVRESEAEFRMLSEHCTDAIMRIAPTGEISYVSPAVRELTGYTPDELIGRRSRVLVDARDFDRVVSEHRAAMSGGGGAHSYSYRMRRKDGEVRWLETHARAITADEETQLLAIMRDVTAFREREAELSEAALTDRLTGLPNRRALEAALARLRPGDHCLALLDLDRFKQVNDTYGHDAGDAVLKGFADVARRLVRSHDMVARLGGEEFVILFEHTPLEQAYEVCERMRRLVGRTLLATPAGPLRITASGGVAVIGRKGLEAALKAADEALYRAKRGGRDRLLIAA